MTRIATVLALSLVLVGGAAAGDGDVSAPALRRGIVDGKYVDEYFDLTYEAPGLGTGFGFGLGGPTVFWSGECAGGVDVELHCVELDQAVTPEDLLKADLEAWSEDGKERPDLTHGLEPVPFAVFVQKSVGGILRQNGYAYYARGTQAFIVHALVRERSDTSAEAVRAALGGLKLGPKQVGYLRAHVMARHWKRDPRDLLVLLRAGLDYASPKHDDPMRTLEVLLHVRQRIGPQTLDADQTFELWRGIGLAQLNLGKHEEALATWREAVRLAAPTTRPEESLVICRYNLACTYSRLGRVDEGFDALAAAFVDLPPTLAGMKTFAGVDPDLAALRADTERWKTLLE